ncbi:MAG TPA: PQQ-dependent sugar dehydrogenase [Candidatus Limnocylindria bacterium]
MLPVADRPISRAATIALALSLLATLVSAPQGVAAAAPTLTATVVQGGLSLPWDVAFTPDGEMLVTERPGRVRVFASGAAGAALLRTVTIPSVHAEGEAGLMGIAVDVAYASNRFVYVCASRDVSAQWTNQVLRYTVASDGSWTAGTVLLTGMRAATIHNGCAVEMDASGKLWVTMGDANQSLDAQDPARLNGKVLRINRDGSIPADNPVMPGAAARSAVYSMGHRNPQGIAFRPGSDQVFTAEHGPELNDEINRIVPGANYGWPCYTGAGLPYVADPACGPANAYSNPAWASGASTIATSGLAFADGLPWADDDGGLFVAQLKEQDLRRFSVTADGSTATQAEVLFNGSWGRIRAVVRGPAGQLYLTTSNGSNDRVIRIAAAAPSVNRLAGPDRFATAAAVSAATTSPGVPVAYVATGENFPDAVAGGAAASHDHGPLLLVRRTAIPDVTATELARLAPARMVVLGGSGVVSDAVLAALDAYTGGPVTRLAGADRYATAAAISAATFGTGVAAAFVATGADYADALAGGPAAAHYGGPVLLTRPGDLPAATQAELQRLAPQRIFVLGGPGAISDGVAAALDAYTAGPVTRLWGADRYATAEAVATLWSRADHAYLATGAAFPDGLSGSAAAGREDVPLLIVRPGSVPTSVGEAILRLHPTRLTILGGTGAVSSSVEAHLAALLGAP